MKYCIGCDEREATHGSMCEQCAANMDALMAALNEHGLVLEESSE